MVFSAFWGMASPGEAMPSDRNRSLTEEEEREIRRELAALLEEHRDLDNAIAALGQASVADTMSIQRLKKRKLALKDRIAKLEDRLLPDIIA
jgi:hypothetical protein